MNDHRHAYLKALDAEADQAADRARRADVDEDHEMWVTVHALRYAASLVDHLIQVDDDEPDVRRQQ